MISSSDSVLFHENESEFESLKAVIKKKIGFNCDEYKEAHFKRRLTVRLRANRCKSYREYAEILLKNEKEYQKLEEALTINVTEFFRNPETYEAFRRVALSELIKTRGEKKTIKIWSAGCSDGKEPYSIAIMLHEVIGLMASNYNISILGTDIDEDCLNKAGNGLYQPKDLEKMSEERLRRFFVKKDNNYRVNDKIRRMIELKQHDLISGPRLSGFDAIFCRNVTIYFEQKLQERLYLNFYNALNQNGYFVMGKTETLIGQAARLFKSVDLKERIYQKVIL